MKNIYVIDFDKALNELPPRKEEYVIIYLFNYKDDAEPLISFRKAFHMKLLWDIVEICIDNQGLHLLYWQADSIIRLCERCIDTKDIFVIHKNMINVAMNVADELALCYDLSFEFKDIPRNEYT